MPKLYHSVPLDEEQSLSGLPEKKVWTVVDTNVLARTLGKIHKHWIWLIHAVLLSVSMTLFTLSFCSKTMKPTDPAFLEKIATYCKFGPLP
jgi:hypothetical protein